MTGQGKPRCFLLIVIPFVLALAQPASSAELWHVSVKAGSLPRGERIVGFWVKLKSADIYAVPRVPTGWAVKIWNSLNEEPPWNTSLEAVVGVGAAALEPTYFTDFLIIQKYSSRYADPLVIQVVLSTTVDFAAEQRRTFDLKGLSLRPFDVRTSTSPKSQSTSR